MEADYLKRVVGGCLAEGLAEVSTVRPSDPIEYLALWILKHKQNLKQAELARVEKSQHEKGVAVGAEGEQQAEPTLTAAATGELHSAGPTPGERSESGQSAPTPTILVEVPERKTSGKLSRIEEEKEEELARSNVLLLQMTTTGVRKPGERDDTVELPKQEHSPDQT